MPKDGKSLNQIHNVVLNVLIKLEYSALVTLPPPNLLKRFQNFVSLW